jgi:hypothetical protein
MDYSFPRYLVSKRTVDDRALNARVFERLRLELKDRRPLRIIEAGAGIGSMLVRLLEQGLLAQAEYTAVDESSENMAYAGEWLPLQARELGLQSENDQGLLRIHGRGRDVRSHLLVSNIFDYISSQPARADLLIAHAFLDLLPLPASLLSLFSLLLPGGLAWLTLNFDGATIFEPVIDPPLDAQIEALYHRSMDARVTGGQPSGDSRTGRHLFSHLRQVGAEILDAGASDWVVFPRQGGYPADEAYFLHHILYFFESSLKGYPDLDQRRFAEWLTARHAQVERGELVYIAHQMDFLVKVKLK